MRLPAKYPRRKAGGDQEAFKFARWHVEDQTLDLAPVRSLKMFRNAVNVPAPLIGGSGVHDSEGAGEEYIQAIPASKHQTFGFVYVVGAGHCFLLHQKHKFNQLID